MSRILHIPAASRPEHGAKRAAKVASPAGNLTSYAASGLLFTAFMTAALAVSVLFSLAGLL